MKGLFVRFALADDGQDLIEYALLAALISLTATASIMAIGSRVNQWYESLDSRVTSATSGF